ncbi:hypothetical protein [Luteithermobacter gelatinilyticus]|uniref:hypothetical protein n=1 Tax=Luteithermobacter gelatinilyticus TaxID=2582913 RepID=UPI00110697D6|nr:hypothetical protein [Luteithermobacter gelatinilyticus]
MGKGNSVLKGTVFSLLIITLFILWTELSPETLSLYGTEDGVIENISAVFFLISSAGFFIVAWKSTYLKQSGSRWSYFMILSWAVLMFVFFGEEISWGQRIFDFNTPESLSKINEQQEFNLHNIALVNAAFGGKYRYLSLMILLTGIVFPLLALSARGKALFQKFAFPVCPLQFSLLFLGSYIYGKYYLVWNPATGVTPLNNITEVREFLFGLGMACFALYGVYKPNSLFLADR